MTNEEKVLIRGKVFLYKAKAPFVPSGVSIYGALEYDEAEEKVRCHECGDWLLALSVHISTKHKMHPRAYRARHGLRVQTSLSAPSAFATQRQQRPSTPLLEAGKRSLRSIGRPRPERYQHAERINENNTCQAQILARLEALAERLGRTPKCSEIVDAGMHVGSILLRFNVRSMSDVFSLIGLKGNPRGAGSGAAEKNQKYDRPVLIELMRDFYVKYRRKPGRSDERAGLIPSLATYYRHFGSMAAAYEAAGLGKIA